jgi:hypothetical protein
MNDEHQKERSSATMPSDIDEHIGWFDRFATKASEFAARAPFFSMCILVVLLWAPSIIWLDMSTWQLIINTTTTIITFLMVALLQNTESRNDAALQHKLNAIAGALADIMQHLSEEGGKADLKDRREELRRAIGLEEDESA